jgi:sugar lactone lactonase YvrE
MAAALVAVFAFVAAPAAPARARNKFDTQVLTMIPDPGFVALSVLGPDRTIYGGTFFPASGNGGDGVASKVFAWGPDGVLKSTWTVEGQDLSGDHGVQASVVDAYGRVYLLGTSPPEVRVLDPATGAQSVYATVPDIPSCGGAVTTNCSQTSTDNPPEPDYAAWGPDGSLYLTDDTQATIFKVPPGGGIAQPWLTDPHFDAVEFGLTGLALMPDLHTLAVTTVGSNPSVDPNAADGKLYTVPINPDGSPGSITELWRSGPAEAPDGFAFALSGNVYVALLGPGVNQIVELSPTGQELARYPSPAQNAMLDVPFDSPSSVIFDGDRLLVTNDSYFAGDRSNQVIFDVFAGEPGAPLFIPPAAIAPVLPAPPPKKRSTAKTATKPRLKIAVRPRSVKINERVKLRIRVVVLAGATKSKPRRAHIRLAGHTYKLNKRTRITITRTFHKRGRVRLRVTAAGDRPGRATIRVRR